MTRKALLSSVMNEVHMIVKNVMGLVGFETSRIAKMMRCRTLGMSM